MRLTSTVMMPDLELLKSYTKHFQETFDAMLGKSGFFFDFQPYEIGRMIEVEERNVESISNVVEKVRKDPATATESRKTIEHFTLNTSGIFGPGPSSIVCYTGRQIPAVSNQQCNATF